MSTYSNELELYNVICQAAGCFDRATNKIEVRAGPQKVIFLLLCSHCVSKFEEDDCPKSNTVLRVPHSLNEVKDNVH
jgi:hypothetical protein